MGPFDFLKRKKSVEETKIEINNSYDNKAGIKIGQKLFAQNGETVTVYAIKEKTIIVDYKNKNMNVISRSLENHCLF